MYAVVNFTDRRKGQNLEVRVATDDLEHAKKVAFQSAKEDLSKEKNTENSIKKLTSKINLEYEYLYPINKVIIAYRIIKLVKHKKKFKIEYCFDKVYAVVEMKPIDKVEEIESSLICDDFYTSDDEESDEGSDNDQLKSEVEEDQT